MTRTKWLASLVALAVALPFGAAAEEAPGWFKIPGTDSSIKFNGFAEMTYVYDLVGETLLANAGEVYNNPAVIELDNNAPGSPTKLSPNSLGFTAVYSRFGFNTKTPSSVGEIGTRIEGDFNSYAGQNLQGATYTYRSYFRIRHAYGTMGDYLLLGQTWTNFADLNTFADIQDENPQVNYAALRAPMVRVTLPAGPTQISLAAESPYKVTGAFAAPLYWTIPDFTAKLFVPMAWGSFSIRGMTRQFKTTEVSKQGFGGAAGAAVKVGGDTLLVDAVVGAGLGPYAAGASAPDAVQTSLTNAELVTSYGGTAAYTHVWSPQFRSNLMLTGYWVSGNDTIKAAVPAATYAAYNKAIYTAGVNTFWSIAKNFWVGAELYYNVRQTFEDAAGRSAYGHESRAELTSHFDFM